MDKRKLILKDVATIVLVGLVAILFGYPNVGGTQVLAGRAVCYISMVVAALSLAVRRTSRLR